MYKENNMALRITIDNTTVGVPFSTAYAKISHFNGTSQYVNYHVDVYATQEARVMDALRVAAFAYKIEGAITGDLMAALYADLKTRPGFENAEDC